MIGFIILGPELEGKSLQLLKEAVSALSRIAVTWNSHNLRRHAAELVVRAPDVPVAVAQLWRRPSAIGGVVSKIPAENV